MIVTVAESVAGRSPAVARVVPRISKLRRNTVGREASRSIPCYGCSAMSSKITVANPYLREPATRARTVLKSVASSSAIEGIRAPFQRTTNGVRKSETISPRSTTRKSPPTRA